MNIRALPTAAFAIVACWLLSGCTPAIESVLAPPKYNFVTTDEVALRDGPEDEDPIIAMLPAGTPVAPVGVNSECVCWQVDALGHTGYVYNRYLTGPLFDAVVGEP
jgi:SH3-like domain-containing protein